MFSICFNCCIKLSKSKNNPERISKIKPFIEGINFLSHRKDWKKFESNNKSVTLNILYVHYDTHEIRHAYKSKHNVKRENQLFLLMITDGEKWYYLAVKEFPALPRRITSKDNIKPFSLI